MKKLIDTNKSRSKFNKRLFLLYTFSFLFSLQMVQAQWTLQNEIDCDFELKIECDDGTTQTKQINSSGTYGFWGTPTSVTYNIITCPCKNPTFTLRSLNAGYGNGTKSFTLSQYLNDVSPAFGGTGMNDPNDKNGPYIFCCCSTCNNTNVTYPCISNGCAAIVIDAYKLYN